MRLRTSLNALLRDGLAGVVGSVVLVFNILSFATLMFPGPLSGGIPTAIWAMLVGSSLAGLWIAWRTSLPPLAVGMDSPTGAALVVLAAACSQTVQAAGGSRPEAVAAMLLLISAASLLTGLLLLGLGKAGWGRSLRFTPSFVVSGFLGATGWLLMAGGVRMGTGLPLEAWVSGWHPRPIAALTATLLVLGLLLSVRQRARSPLALPLTLLALTVGLHGVARLTGPDGALAASALPSLGQLTPWEPWAALQALRASDLPASLALQFVPDLLAVAVVALVSLLAKTTSLEAARGSSADLDTELRCHGWGALAAVPWGGVVGSMQLSTSRLLDAAGGGTRGSGVVAALVLGAVALFSLDLPRWVPLPVAAGLVMLLGWMFLQEAFARPLAQRDVPTLLLALAIAVVCVQVGYLAGVLGGVAAACLAFAVRYARVGPVRLQLSRGQFAGHVIRAPAAAAHLSAQGEAIQIYWLAGYLFFGSSQTVFERVRDRLSAPALPPVRHLILDCRGVSAADASATLGLVKLRRECQRHGVTLRVSGVPAGLQRSLARDGFFTEPEAPQAFADVNEALASAEEAELAAAGLDEAGESVATSADPDGLRTWLQQQLGAGVDAAEFMRYLDTRPMAADGVVCRQGEPSDRVFLVAAGRLAIQLERPCAPPLQLRQLRTHAVVGEMGFIRRQARSATVVAQGPATVLVLTRERFERLRDRNPALAAAFYELLLRSLADRMEMSERMNAALTR